MAVREEFKKNYLRNHSTGNLHELRRWMLGSEIVLHMSFFLLLSNVIARCLRFVCVVPMQKFIRETGTRSYLSLLYKQIGC